jgi:predicted PurR-regulated permease PerM
MPDRQIRVPHALAVASAYSWRLLTITAAAVVVIYVLVTLRLIVIPVFVALLISTLLVPIASRLKRIGVAPLLATWATFMTAVALFALAVFLIAPQISDQLDSLGRDVRRGAEEVLTWLVNGPFDLTRAQIDRYLDNVSEELRASSRSLVSGAFRGVYLLVEVIAGVLLTLVLTFFFVKDGERIAGALLGLVAEPRRDTVRDIARRSWDVLGAYMRGTAIVGLIDAAAIGLALLILGVPLLLPLVIVTFLGAFFPLVGAFTAGALATLVALVTAGVVPAVIVAGVTIIVQQLEGDVLQPLVLGRAVKLHPLVILLSLTAGAIVAGVAGAFLAVPLAAVASVTASYLRSDASAKTTEVAA